MRYRSSNLALGALLFTLVGISFATAAEMSAGRCASAHAGGVSGGQLSGFHHDLGGRFVYRAPRQLFSRSHFNFGAGFAFRRSDIGNGGDYAGALDDDYGTSGEDIENLHFRVQEPFGPGDIGRRQSRPEEEAPYVPDEIGRDQDR